jgi:hypothetical protein
MSSDGISELSNSLWSFLNAAVFKIIWTSKGSMSLRMAAPLVSATPATWMNL